ADLNAHNLLFDAHGRDSMIDFDNSAMPIPATGWREANLARLRRSLLKPRGNRGRDAVLRGFHRVYAADRPAPERGIRWTPANRAGRCASMASAIRTPPRWARRWPPSNATARRGWPSTAAARA